MPVKQGEKKSRLYLIPPPKPHTLPLSFPFPPECPMQLIYTGITRKQKRTGRQTQGRNKHKWSNILLKARDYKCFFSSAVTNGNSFCWFDATIVQRKMNHHTDCHGNRDINEPLFLLFSPRIYVVVIETLSHIIVI